MDTPRFSHPPVADGCGHAEGAHLLPLRRVVEQHKVAEHGGQPHQPQPRDQDDDRVLHIKLARPPVDDEEELDAVGLDEGAAVLLVVEGVAEVPTDAVQDAEIVSKKIRLIPFSVFEYSLTSYMYTLLVTIILCILFVSIAKESIVAKFRSHDFLRYAMF